MPDQIAPPNNDWLNQRIGQPFAGFDPSTWQGRFFDPTAGLPQSKTFGPGAPDPLAGLRTPDDGPVLIDPHTGIPLHNYDPFDVRLPSWLKNPQQSEAPPAGSFPPPPDETPSSLEPTAPSVQPVQQQAAPPGLDSETINALLRSITGQAPARQQSSVSTSLDLPALAPYVAPKEPEASLQDLVRAQSLRQSIQSPDANSVLPLMAAIASGIDEPSRKADRGDYNQLYAPGRDRAESYRMRLGRA